jgi:hypothetical protein
MRHFREAVFGELDAISNNRLRKFRRNTTPDSRLLRSGQRDRDARAHGRFQRLVSGRNKSRRAVRRISGTEIDSGGWNSRLALVGRMHGILHARVSERFISR